MSDPAPGQRRTPGQGAPRSAQLRWVESNGGPLLLLPQRLLGAWRGADGPPGGPTDFERACAVSGYIDRLDVGPGAGLVLGDEPLSTTWLPLAAGGAMVVRWVYAPGQDAVEAALRGIPADLAWEREPFTVETDGAPLLLFDAAYPGGELPAGHLGVTLPGGTYHVETSALRPDAETALLLHRLVPDE